MTGHVEGNLCGGLRGHSRVGDLRPLYERGVIHLSKIETAFEQADDMLVDFCLRKQTSTHSLGEALIGIVETTLHVGTSKDGLRCAMYGIRG